MHQNQCAKATTGTPEKHCVVYSDVLAYFRSLVPRRSIGMVAVGLFRSIGGSGQSIDGPISITGPTVDPRMACLLREIFVCIKTSYDRYVIT